MTFGRVTEQADRILIVATGPSLKSFDWSLLNDLPGIYTIAVKQAILGFNANAWMTVDPNARARAMMRDQRVGTHYYAAVPDDYGTDKPRIHGHGGPAEPNVTFLHRVALSTRLAWEPDQIATGNSAWGALGLAYHMRPKKIGLLGVDGTQAAHAIGVGKPNGKLDHLPKLFEGGVAQLVAAGIRVRNGSPNSMITCFPRCTPADLLTWLKE